MDDYAEIVLWVVSEYYKVKRDDITEGNLNFLGLGEQFFSADSDSGQG